jgi:hypothetical protein
MAEGYSVHGWDESQRKRAEDYYWSVRTKPIILKEDDTEKNKFYFKLGIPVKIKEKEHAFIPTDVFKAMVERQKELK